LILPKLTFSSGIQLIALVRPSQVLVELDQTRASLLVVKQTPEVMHSAASLSMRQIIEA
jgi:hypothetical protein